MLSFFSHYGTAPELKTRVAQQVFGDAIPDEISQGRLEDVMEVFQRIGGESGYELVAQEIRQFTDQPDAYRLLPDLIRHGFVRTQPEPGIMLKNDRGGRRTAVHHRGSGSHTGAKDD